MTVTNKHLALSAAAACLMSVLILMGFNPWLSVVIVAALGVVWSAGEIVAEEIQRRQWWQAKTPSDEERDHDQLD